MLLNDVVHLSTGYILSIFLSWKENTNKPVKQNKKYKTQGNFPNKSKIILIDIRRLTIFKIVIYNDFDKMLISFCETQYAIQDRKTKNVAFIFTRKIPRL